MNRKRKISRSVVALAVAGAVALTGCDTDPDDNGGTLDDGTGDTTVTTVADTTVTTIMEETTTTPAG
jgi:hypothetical protein